MDSLSLLQSPGCKGLRAGGTPYPITANVAKGCSKCIACILLRCRRQLEEARYHMLNLRFACAASTDHCLLNLTSGVFMHIQTRQRTDYHGGATCLT